MQSKYFKINNMFKLFVPFFVFSLIYLSSATNIKKEIKSITAQKLTDLSEGDTIYNELFLVFIRESGSGTKLPFLLSGHFDYSPQQISGVLLYEKRNDIFLVVDITSNENVSLTNRDGQFYLKIGSFSFHVNKCKITEENAGENNETEIDSQSLGDFKFNQDRTSTSGGLYQDKHPKSHCEIEGDSTFTKGETKVTIKHYKLLGIPNIPTYLTPNYSYLLPSNFDYNKDQIYTYPSSSYIEFVGTVTISAAKLEPPKVVEGQNSVSLFTFERTYLIFKCENMSYGIPIKINTKCIIGLGNGIIDCKDERVKYVYSVSEGTLAIGDMKAFTINLFGLRMILSSNTGQIVDLALARISEEFPARDHRKQ
ncbi:hypothetical protein FG386_000480 [Cryptosporidium ryanae]|uniref:uncharacterized protein n=1 Tax=Cryptosporidium ryanae TaxID=515981 RepID=UPI003519F87F|nr:hypothetical protein FG386_000480 [Cryptosporidium ryanae]